jgi:hypothetical protein
MQRYYLECAPVQAPGIQSGVLYSFLIDLDHVIFFFCYDIPGIAEHLCADHTWRIDNRNEWLLFHFLVPASMHIGTFLFLFAQA